MATIEMKQNHQWILERHNNKWGGHMFKCIQCGDHDIVFSGNTEEDAFRHLSRKLKTHSCEDANISILSQFQMMYGKLLKEMIL